jgi:hypothetical protein
VICTSHVIHNAVCSATGLYAYKKKKPDVNYVTCLRVAFPAVPSVGEENVKDKIARKKK